MKALGRALVGLILVFVYHVPHLIFRLLMVSYAYVFWNRPTLTANPEEHLKRATTILRRGDRSELLYAALELRFALERMAQRDLIFAPDASNRMLDENHPGKKLSNLHRLAPESAHRHEVFLINRATGERIKWGDYKPLDKKRVNEIQGRLGDLLHPKDGLMLGMPDDSWYVETTKFLNESCTYLQGLVKGNLFFFSCNDADDLEMIRVP